jgi:hypothetical protein
VNKNLINLTMAVVIGSIIATALVNKTPLKSYVN